MKKCSCGERGPCKSTNCKWYELNKPLTRKDVIEMIGEVIRKSGGLSDFDYEYYIRDAELIYEKLNEEGILK